VQRPDQLRGRSARPRSSLRHDPGKIERELGWRPRENFESGLAKTVRWFCDNRTWWQNILDHGYQSAHRPRLVKNSVVIRSATHRF